MLDQDKIEQRDSILNQIENALECLSLEVGNNTPIRIVGGVATDLLDPEDRLASIEPFVKEVQRFCVDAKTRFLAVEINPQYSIFAVDVNNHYYDYATAHIVLKALETYILKLVERPRMHRDSTWDRYMAERLAEMHNIRGWEPFPLVEDFTKPPVYTTPRSLDP
ncbi:hypothetical protein BDV06DRAFT_85893 [Aspergillus oleicola]